MAYARDMAGFESFVRAELAGLVLHVLRLDRDATLEDAQDAVDEALYEALCHWSGLDNPGGWVMTAARRHYIAGRRLARRVKADGPSCLEGPAPAPGPEQAVLRADQEDRVRRALARLPRRQAEVFALDFDGHTTAEIAKLLDITEATVRSHLRHARGRLGAEGTMGPEGGNS